MLKFTFVDSQRKIYETIRQPTADCNGGCCLEQAVQEYREKSNPAFVPGDPTVTITIKRV